MKLKFSKVFENNFGMMMNIYSISTIYYDIIEHIILNKINISPID